MVSIESRLSILDEAKQSKKVEAFYAFISKEQINVIPEGSSATDHSYYRAINSILNDDGDEFSSIYSEFTSREPVPQSPFVHDDFLIFVLICGIKKNNINDTSWITKVLNLRSNSQSESFGIKTTFLNIIKENFKSTDNLFEIIIVLQNVLDKDIIGSEIINQTYSKISQLNTSSLYKSLFLNLITFKAFDAIVLAKEISGSEVLNRLKKFERRFNQRVLLLSRIFYVLTIMVLIYLGYRLIGYKDSIKDELNTLSIFFQLLGVALIGSLNKAIIGFYSRSIKAYFANKN